MRPTGSHISRHAFTLIELFVVLSIAAIVITIATPAITGLVRSSQASLSSNAVLGGATIARDLAQREGSDVAAVFLRDEGGPIRILIAIKAGDLDDFDEAYDPYQDGVLNNQPIVRREVFAPIPDAPVLELAEAFEVRGFAAPYSLQPLGTIGEDEQPVWYDSNLYGGNGDPNGVPVTAKLEGNWIAPESGHYDPTDPGGATVVSGGSERGTPRQSFMLRFEGGTGKLVLSGPPVLVVDPRPALHLQSDYQPAVTPDVASGAPRDWWRAEQADSAYDWARTVLRAEADAYWGVDPSRDRRRVKRALLIGLYSNDTVLCAPVSRVSVYRTTELANAIGGTGVNAITNSLYEPFEKNGQIALDTGPPASGGGVAYRSGVLSAFNGDEQLARERINQWINGDTNFNGQLFDLGRGGTELPDSPAAQIFTVDPVSGDLREVVR
ncbi:MAG: hypothetical protein CMJ31_09860 [Phycisphaerae bacterium]|nr:hypothetical protein [Phycisphaerae bacterium]